MTSNINFRYPSEIHKKLTGEPGQFTKDQLIEYWTLVYPSLEPFIIKASKDTLTKMFKDSQIRFVPGKTKSPIFGIPDFVDYQCIHIVQNSKNMDTNFRPRGFEADCIEVARFADSMKWTAERDYGVYYYYAPGSGIFLPLGKSLIAWNKIDALSQLIGSDTLKQKIMNKDPGFDCLYYYIVKKKDSLWTCHIPVPAYPGTLNQFITNATKGECCLYPYYSALDSFMGAQAKAKGYDTIQLIKEPTTGCSSGYEIIDLKSPYQSYLNTINDINIKCKSNVEAIKAKLIY